MATKERPATSIVIGPIKLSYVNLLTPQSIEDGAEKKYSVSLLIPKSDKAMVKAINAAVEAAKEQGKGKWGGKLPPKLKLPLRDGDEEKPDDDIYAGMWFIQAYSKSKPQVIDLAKKLLESEEDVYSGMIGRVSVNFYPYDVSGKGIACGLNNVQKVKDGERLAGRRSAAEDFDDDFELPESDDDEL